MEILLTDWCKDWRGKEHQELEVQRLSLDNKNILFALIVSVGNGNFEDVCFDFDSDEAKEVIVGLLTGTGGAKRIEPDTKARLSRLYKEGYEVYLQGDDSYHFLAPAPKPALFSAESLDAYIAEFK
jgi:hypothetical protein